MEATSTSVRTGRVRWVWFAVGWMAVALGSIGVVVPGLPTTGFFVLAASCFARSSPRFERWVLNLPKVGPLVRDYRAGLGMPRRAKLLAVGAMVLAGGASVVFAISNPYVDAVVIALLVVGAWYVLFRVPTRERVLEARAAAAAAGSTEAGS
ncbi:MAG: YbaN family protein [Acidimicrobiales bacterium]